MRRFRQNYSTVFKALHKGQNITFLLLISIFSMKIKNPALQGSGNFVYSLLLIFVKDFLKIQEDNNLVIHLADA